MGAEQVGISNAGGRGTGLYLIIWHGGKWSKSVFTVLGLLLELPGIFNCFGWHFSPIPSLQLGW